MNNTIDTMNTETNATLFGAIAAANYCLYQAFTAYAIQTRAERALAAIPSYLRREPEADREPPMGVLQVEHSPWQRWVEAYRNIAERCVDAAWTMGRPQILEYLRSPEQQADELGQARKPKAQAEEVQSTVPARFQGSLGKGQQAALSAAAQRNGEDARQAMAEIDAYAAACEGAQVALHAHELKRILERYHQSVESSVTGSMERGFYHGFDGTLRPEMAGELLVIEQVLKDVELEIKSMEVSAAA